MHYYQLDGSRFGKRFLVCLSLTILLISVNARFYDERFESLARHDRPWIRIDRDLNQDFASSEYSPSYSRFPASRKREAFDSSESFDRPREWLSASSTKKIPLEDKSFKKMISPFYTITEKDSSGYKDMVMKSGIPYCQEVKTKRSNDEGNANDSMLCYKCKNPKNGATYEQCSYVSQPTSTDSSNVVEAVTPSGFRNRRSNRDESSYSYGDSEDRRKRDNPYRFNEKIFSDASMDVPAEYKDKNEKCEKIAKDSMVCMICMNTATNGKYEQCSYVRKPSEKTYAYTQSSAFKKPEREADEGNEQDTRREDNREYAASKPVREHAKGAEEKKEREIESNGSKESSSSCKQIEKDSKTCTVCKDPETGRNYEKCSYTYQPNDKVYKFSRSKSFGYPRESSSKDDSHREGVSSDKLKRESDDEYSRDYSVPESFYKRNKPSRSTSYFKDEPRFSYRQADDTSDHAKSSTDEDEESDYASSKSESERIAGTVEAGNCKEVQKDSMTCKVCKDPKTGSNSEQCSYKNQPSDKRYTYSKSTSFGKPSDKEDKRRYDGSENKGTREPRGDRTYAFSSDGEPYVTDRDGKQDSAATSESSAEEKRESNEKSLAPKKAETDFYDAFEKKAEIRKFMQEFRKEDRSNCERLMRDKMTCYRCVDEKGFQKEECAFIADGESTGDKKNESSETIEPSKKVSRSVMEEGIDEFLLEPEASASKNVQTREETSESRSSEETEKLKEAGPYEFVDETRPVFDKVLGITLPAFMLDTSEHEEEFDKTVSSGRI